MQKFNKSAIIAGNIQQYVRNKDKYFNSTWKIEAGTGNLFALDGGKWITEQEFMKRYPQKLTARINKGANCSGKVFPIN